MKQSFKLENLDCANCAAKMENTISHMDGVNSCKISFITQKMILDTEDDKNETIINQAKAAIKKVDRHVKVKTV